MSLDRKDLRFKLDHDVHEALGKVCERDGMDMGEFVERLIERAMVDEMHRYNISRDAFEGLGLLRKIRGTTGNGK